MKEKMKILDLFSGIGGFSLGLESTGHFETTAFCEIDKFCKLILNKHWEGKKIYDDVKTISKKQFEEDGIELPDIITGGFPCQPFSVAGKQQGTSDSRHLWPEMFRIIKDFSPRWVIGENVKGLTNIQDGVVFETVCSDLEGEGYEVRTFNIPAAGVQAPHRRERLWIIAHSKSQRTWKDNEGIWQGSSRISGGQETNRTKNVVDPFSQYESEPIRGSDETQSRIQEEHRQNDSASRESSRTGSVWGTNNGHENLENSDNNGFERGLTETRNETIAGKESTINGIKNSDNSSRRSNGTGDSEQSRTNGTVQGLRNDDQEESTRATGIRGLHERTNIGQGTAREDGHHQDDSGALVQKGQSRVQSSISGGLERNQDPFQESEIRQRDDSAALNRMETGRDENMENSRRTLQQGTELSEKNENETRKGNANIDQRSSGTSRSDVANTESIGSNVGGASSKTSDDVGITKSIGRKHSTHEREREGYSTRCGEEKFKGHGENVVDSSTGRCAPQETKVQPGRYGSFDSSWWQSEPNVGRVAHGVSGRVHRLKSLGNSIVPKIVQEIGNAIIQAEREKELDDIDARNGF
jgi:DNA (cytosine-5)-methyltransferase 1